MGMFLKSVRVEGFDRIRPLALRTGRPATDTPDASIALGSSRVIPVGQKTNYLDDALEVVFRVIDVQFEPLVDDEFDHAG